MKKIISIILILLMIIGIISIPKKAIANFEISKADLYSKGYYEGYLRWGGMGLVFNYVVYEKDGKEYPAYCLNKDLDGVTGSSNYSVTTNELLTNVNVWRAIINGYPYKTPAQLGCNTNEEAFFATKQAVYCMLYDRDPNTYSATDEVSTRVLNALIKIVTDARNSSEVKQSANLTIKDVTEAWMQDEEDKNYVSKIYKVSANAGINSYIVNLENLQIEGVKITNEKNEEKQEFNASENFKILLPIKSLTANGEFNIKVEGKVAAKPVLYGYSENRNMQDYAITGSIYEEGEGIKTVNYTQNETKIKIKKQNEEGENLEGVKFNLLNENKEVIFSELTTNKEGEVTIKNLNPGKYYIEETHTLNGYSVYDELMEAEVNYNEEYTITVTNTKEKVEIEKPEVIKKEETIKLPKTGM